MGWTKHNHVRSVRLRTNNWFLSVFTALTFSRLIRIKGTTKISKNFLKRWTRSGAGNRNESGIGGLYHFWVAVGSVVINYSPQRKFLAAHLLCAITQKLLGGVRESKLVFERHVVYQTSHDKGLLQCCRKCIYPAVITQNSTMQLVYKGFVVKFIDAIYRDLLGYIYTQVA